MDSCRVSVVSSNTKNIGLLSSICFYLGQYYFTFETQLTW
uniref:Uncharacterized protein n=1 Tax=Lepeophtheirus salmonis TaxID=72036 RepID=A0A0K2V1J3_LEPSM